MTQHCVTKQRERRLLPVFLACAALLVLFWAYAATLGEIAWRWGADAQYSHGYLVPVFALALLWFRRHQLDLQAFRPSFLGLAVLGFATGVRLAGAYLYYPWLDQFS